MKNWSWPCLRGKRKPKNVFSLPLQGDKRGSAPYSLVSVAKVLIIL